VVHDSVIILVVFALRTAAVPLTLGDFVLHDTLGREWEGELGVLYTLFARLHEFMYACSLLCRLCCVLCRDVFGHHGSQKHRSKWTVNLDPGQLYENIAAYREMTGLARQLFRYQA
jgi:hypothetical protein